MFNNLLWQNHEAGYYFEQIRREFGTKFDERNISFWQQLSETIENTGKNIADIVTLIPRIDYYDMTYSTPIQIMRLFEFV